jgi:hypothetical protein
MIPATGTKYQISKGTGLQALWSPDGTELLYNPAPGEYVVVSVRTRPSFMVGEPMQIARTFFTGPQSSIRQFDMMPSGKIVGIVAA